MTTLLVLMIVVLVLGWWYDRKGSSERIRLLEKAVRDYRFLLMESEEATDGISGHSQPKGGDGKWLSG